jgi:hypothetical protein
MTGRGRFMALITAVTVASVGCANTVAIRGVDELMGEWKGRRFGPAGNAPAAITVGQNGAYTGVTYLDGGDRPLRGALVVVRPGQIRYQGTDGAGAVQVLTQDGHRVLKFRRDDGGVDAVFRDRDDGAKPRAQ